MSKMPPHKSSKKSASTQKSRSLNRDNSNSTISLSKINHNSSYVQRNKKKQYNIGLSDSMADNPLYKFSGKQTKNWKPVNKHLKDYILNLIDSGVKMVGSKPQFSDSRDVRKILSDLKSRLKGEIEAIRVPNKKYGDHTKLRKLCDELTQQLEKLKTQEILLEKSIRHEERQLEALDDIQGTVEEIVQLDLKIPNDVLKLPSITT